MAGDGPCRRRTEAAAHAGAEAAHDGRAARIGDESVLVLADLCACACRKEAERQSAGNGEAGLLAGEGVSHDVVSMTALLWLRKKILSGHGQQYRRFFGADLRAGAL